jgi:hypothetical protein
MTRMMRAVSLWLLAIPLSIGLVCTSQALITPAPGRSVSAAPIDSVVRVAATAQQEAVRREFRQIDSPVWRFELSSIGVQSLPLALAADDSHVFLANATGSLIALNRASRRVVWTRSVGDLGGTVRQIISMNSNSILVLFAAGEGPMRLSKSNGDVVARWSNPSPTLLQSGCSVVGRLVLLSAVDTGQSLVFFDSAGALIKRAPLPWPELQSAHPLQRQLAMAHDSQTGSCVLALIAGHGFAVFDRYGAVAVRPYAEYAAIGPVVVRTTTIGLEKTIESRLIDDALPISEISASNGLLYIPFSARTLRGPMVDVFALPGGAYRYTLRSPHDMRRIAAAGTRLFAATYDRGFPVVMGYRMPEKD